MELKFVALRKRFDSTVRIVSNLSIPDFDGIEGPFYAALDVNPHAGTRLVWQSEDWTGYDEVTPVRNYEWVSVDGGKEAAVAMLRRFAEKSEKPVTVDEDFDWGDRAGN